MASDPSFFASAAVDGIATFENGDGTTAKEIVADPGANGGVVRSIYVRTDETSENFMILYLTIGGTDYEVAKISIPAYSGEENAGGTIVNPVDVMAGGLWSSSLDENNLMKFQIGNGTSMKASFKTAVASGKKAVVYTVTNTY